MIATAIAFTLIATACGIGTSDAAETPGSDPRADGELVSASLRAPDGRLRTYHVYLPSGAGEEPLPLLIAMHGGTGWGLQFRDASGFDALAESEGFIVAYPDGTQILRRSENRVWNGGACCGLASDSRRGVDDVGFVSAMIDEITAHHRVDPGRIYATGHSNGAIMAYRLACELGDRIVAVGLQAGSLEIDGCRPGEPVSVMAIHGADDTNIPIDGGPGSGISDHDFFSPRLSIEHLARVNGCATDTTAVDPVNADVTRRTWAGCDDNVTVQFVEVAGASHAWMGRPTTLLQWLLSGRPYRNLDTAATVWEFVSRFERD
jgi:polyhydroxybutyrate depolymerase